MACDNCRVDTFSVDGVAQTGTSLAFPGFHIAMSYRGMAAPGHNPTWKVQTAGATSHVLGLMAWECLAQDGKCKVKEGADECEEIFGCEGFIRLKCMYMLPKGVAPNVHLTSPAGVQVDPDRPPFPLKGNANFDVYDVHFVIPLDAACGGDGTLTIDNTWAASLNGNAGTYHAASGSTAFKLTCNPCKGDAADY